MYLVYLLLIMVIILMTKMRYNTLIKPNILFTMMWGVCAGLSSLGINEVFRPSAKVHIYSIMTIIIFNSVYFIGSNIGRKKQRDSIFKRIEKKENMFFDEIRSRLILWMNIAAWIFLYPYLNRAFKLIESVGFANLRAFAFRSSTELASTTQLLFIQWIIQPLFIVTIIFGVVHLVSRRTDNYIWIVGVIDIALYTILFGGRYLIVQTMMYYIFVYLLLKRSHVVYKVKTYIRKPKKVILLIGISVLLLITMNRSLKDMGFIENLITYFTGGFSVLSEYLMNPELYMLKEADLYGQAMLGFIINPIEAVLSILMGFDYTGSDHLITQITSRYIQISPSISYNAMTTMLYPFLRDFGSIGIIMGTSFLALASAWLERMYNKKNNILFLSMYVYILFVLFNSVMNYSLLSPSVSTTIIYFLLLVKSNKKRKGD